MKGYVMRVPRLALVAGLAASSFSSFAQEASIGELDLKAAEDLADNLGNALSGFVTGNVIPAVVLVVGSVASLLLLYRLVRWLMRALGGR